MLLRTQREIPNSSDYMHQKNPVYRNSHRHSTFIPDSQDLAADTSQATVPRPMCEA